MSLIKYNYKKIIKHIIACLMLSCTLASAQTLVWSEEFNYTSAPDSDVWSYDTGNWGWGNQELQNYTTSTNNSWVDGSNLVIKAVKSGSGGGATFTSARLKTVDKLTFKYGTVEARIQTPDLANGLWPAFWTLGNSFEHGTGWPGCGEIDIMEMGNADAINAGVINKRVGSHFHWGTLPNHPNYGDHLDYSTDIKDTFVVYKMVWTPTQISTYINNQHIVTMNTADIPEFNEPHFFILNMAVGGTYTGILNANDVTANFPAEYKIDYIRLYDNGDTVLGGSSRLPAPPVFTSNSYTMANAMEDVAYTGQSLAGSATDANDDPLTYSLVPETGPEWLNVATNGALSGTPTSDDVGLYQWSVQVSDGIDGTDTATLYITVVNSNDAPVFTSNSYTMAEATEDAAYTGQSLAGSATDAESDPLSYSLVPASGPAWLNVATNGALTGTPGNDDVGANSWTVRVSDDSGGIDTATLNITVVNVNDSPVFTSDPHTMAEATEDAIYSGQSLAGSATDAENDPLSYSLVPASGPAWLNIATNGTLLGAPRTGDIGTNTWTVQVSDGNGGTDTTTLKIVVIAQEVAGSNLLANPGFESGTTDWSTAGSASGSSTYARSGSDSLLLTGAGGWSTAGASQTFSASPGDVFNMQGYMLNPADSPISGGSFGLFKVVFSDGSSELIPDSVEIGTLQANPSYPGAESVPTLTASSATDTWIFSEVQVEAPAGTTQVSFHIINVSDVAGPMYFDDMQATLIGANNRPVFTSDPINMSGTYSDTAYSNSIAGSATDVDAGASLSYSLVPGGPAWLSVTSGGVLSGTPGSGDVGTNTWAVQVSDEIGATDIATLNIPVLNANNAPVFTDDPITLADTFEGVAYSNSIAGSATDIDAGATQSYSLVAESGPAWLNVATNGVLSGTPGNGDVGTNSWTVQVSDGNGGTDTATLEITVVELLLPTLNPSVQEGGNIQISFATQNGVSYPVVYKTNLTDATWTLLETIEGDGTTKSPSYTTTNGPVRFYKVLTP